MTTSNYKIKYFSNHWLDLNQILNSRYGDKTEVNRSFKWRQPPIPGSSFLRMKSKTITVYCLGYKISGYPTYLHNKKYRWNNLLLNLCMVCYPWSRTVHQSTTQLPRRSKLDKKTQRGPRCWAEDCLVPTREVFPTQWSP